MAKRLKLHISGKAYLISFRCLEGLPFVSNNLIIAMFLGVIARAQVLFPIYLCHYIVMQNHVHINICSKSSRMLLDGCPVYKERDFTLYQYSTR